MVWAEKYDTDLADVFEVQDEIAIGVVEKIAAYVRRAEIKRALRKPPKSLNAYDYLLRALELLYKFDFASFSRAKGLLERASEEAASMRRRTRSLRSGTISRSRRGGRRISMRIRPT